MKPSTALVSFVLVCAASAVGASESADRPATVDAKHWIKIADGLGFVVVEATERPQGGVSRQLLLVDPAAVSVEHRPPKKGYFVIRTSAGWQPVVVTEPTLTSLGER